MNALKPDIDIIADSLLAIIRKRPGAAYQFDALCKNLDIDHDVLSDALQKLASWDYKISVRKSEGVTFLDAPDSLTATEITYNLKTSFVGRTCHSYRTVKSTNDLASQIAESGSPASEGTIITSEEQTKGRGRLGRSWHSPFGTGIYLSIILKPRFAPERAPGISIMTALALAKTLEPYSPGDIQIKWPNDVLINGKKTAGILTELSAERNKINCLVVGVGINVNQGVENFPEELRNSATSLRRALKHKVRRVPLLQSFLVHFEKEYLIYQKHDLTKSHARLKRYSSLLGHDVKILSGSHITSGKAIDIDSRGCLILKQTDGTRVAISAGEVSVVKE
ncbi:MAG: biotin--[acetyl-CoA-carboxylase] ligase [candidate division Zixibacteria bacterium]|nr:biotin--[acetyl-CoA-carboxylase] ligase [candidate division Zixibacteria bacterium]